MIADDERKTLSVYQGGLRDIVRVCSVAAVVFGLGLILGGPERFGSPGFATARLMPGGCYTWGAALALFGCVSLAGVLVGWYRSRRIIVLGVTLQGCWYMFFAVTIFLSFLEDDKVATTGWMIYGLTSIIHFILCSVGLSLRGLPR